MIWSPSKFMIFPQSRQFTTSTSTPFIHTIFFTRSYEVSEKFKKKQLVCWILDVFELNVYFIIHNTISINKKILNSIKHSSKDDEMRWGEGRPTDRPSTVQDEWRLVYYFAWSISHLLYLLNVVGCWPRYWINIYKITNEKWIQK